MTSNGQPGHAPCHFCGQAPKPGQHRVSGPQGPICADCIESGLWLAASRKHEVDGEQLVRLDTADDGECEFCERQARLSFLGFRRKLTRVRAPGSGAVVCADCLDWAGDLINRAVRG